MPNYRPKNDPTANAVLKFIREYRKEHGGISPSMREISEGCYLSVSSVISVLDVLEAWGKIYREKKIARGIQLLDEDR